MGTTPKFGLRYPEPTDPADVPTDMHELAIDVETAMGTVGVPSVGATPPASPVDGQTWLLPVVAGVNWLFRYNAAGGTYKWEFIGGSWAQSEILTTESIAFTTYADPATPGPTVTVPRAGVYDLAYGAYMHANGNTNNLAAAAPNVGGTAPVDTDAAVCTGFAFTPTRQTRKTIAAAATAVKLQYKITAGQPGQAGNRWLKVIPVQVA